MNIDIFNVMSQIFLVNNLMQEFMLKSVPMSPYLIKVFALLTAPAVT
jgi:hypothetical protein